MFHRLLRLILEVCIKGARIRHIHFHRRLQRLVREQLQTGESNSRIPLSLACTNFMGETETLIKITPPLDQKRLRRQEHRTMYSELLTEEQPIIPAANVRGLHGQ